MVTKQATNWRHLVINTYSRHNSLAIGISFLCFIFYLEIQQKKNMRKTYARVMNAIYMLTKEMEALKLNVDRIKKNAKPKRAQILPILPSTNPALINIWTIIPAWNCGSKVGNLLGNVTPSLAIKIACSMHKIQIRLFFSVSFASFPVTLPTS